VSKDATLKEAFDIYKAGYPANEFTGLPVADELMRSFDEQLQKTLSGKQSVDEQLKTSQDTWMKEF
jgi:multiple sugar transport system substrate-binding protein